MKNSTKTTLGAVGAAAAATMAMAAGAYLYLGKDAPKRRKQAAAWMKKAEREIVQEARKLKNTTFTEENYQKVVDMVAKRYKQARQLDPTEIAAFISMMRQSWKKAGAEAKKTAKAKAASAKKSVKKAVKKVTR